MEPEPRQPFEAQESAQPLTANPESAVGAAPPAPPEMGDGIQWVLIGPRGLRWGWSVALFCSVLFLGLAVIGALLSRIMAGAAGMMKGFTAERMALSEAVVLAAVLLAGFVVALVERRRLKDFNLGGPRGVRHFLAGLAVGFAALSALVGLLSLGGWIHFGGVALSGTAIATNALLWGICFLLVGAVEEGIFRGYLQSTLTRGINFWQALAINAVLCSTLVLTTKGYGAWGVHGIALLGLIGCLWLFLKRVEGSGFWYAAWVTSTLFGFVHTGNGGESWVGIFLAGFVGAIFCVSIQLTGSAWWAIGCHAAWDWAQTYFYGTPDSGMVGVGHLLNTTAAGNPLWSGGANGPEGSLMCFAVLVLMLVWLVVVYGRGKKQLPASSC